MTPALERLRTLATDALDSGASVLTEPELYEVLELAGLHVPEHVVVTAEAAPVVWARVPKGPVVLKVVSRDILHKSDVGGVRFLEGSAVTPALVEDFLGEVSARWSKAHGRAPYLGGALVMRRVQYDRSRLGTEVIAGLRFSRDFGFVGMVGLGGVKAELFGARLPRQDSAALFSPSNAAAALREVEKTLVYQDLAGSLRGSTPVMTAHAWQGLLTFLCDVANAFSPLGTPGAPAIEELEFNPLLVDSEGQLVAVDGLARLTRATAEATRPPLDNLKAFFEPRRVCVAGVSSKGVNMGRIILRNLLRDGFPASELVVMKPGEAEIDGVRCVSSPAELTEPVDLAVLAVSAGVVPELMQGLVEGDKARGIIVIPGGMAEKEGGAQKQAAVEAVLERARRRPSKGPVVCGPNSMGVVSAPGHYDTTFIPEQRMPPRRAKAGNLAFISQSGAFTITRGSQLDALTPRYLVSAGNQMDLGVADFVSYVATDPKVQVIAVYVEGFKALDGLRFVQAAQAARAAGKQVILYKGGRSPEGQGTAAGHTAAIAGDYRACWHLSRAAGVLVAESFADFEGLVRVSCALANRHRAGRRVMLLSNAGFEVVGMADQLRGEVHDLSLARLSSETSQRIRAVLTRFKVDELVDVKNPLDLTPSSPDAAYVEVIEAALSDPDIDALVVGIVPMSPALASLGEALGTAQSLAATLPPVCARGSKPVVAVVDGGLLYTPLIHALEDGGVPVFRRADEAVRALGQWLSR